VASPVFLYNPGLLSPAELESCFLVRGRELEFLASQLADFARGRGRQHVYLIGRRGMGKTTLLCRLAHLCAQRDELSNLVPVLLAEESYQVGDLVDLWLEVVKTASVQLGRPDLERSASALMETGLEPGKLGEALLRLVRSAVSEKPGRRMVLLIDCFDEILAALHSEHDQHRLREELQENRQLLLVAASARAAEHAFEHSAPLYDFFRVQVLEPLDEAQVRHLLTFGAEGERGEELTGLLDRHPERLEGIRRLTGGNPRMVVLARQLLLDSPRGDIHSDLAQLLDKVTPYYKHLIENIPRQGRRVFDALARRWAPATAAELSGALRLPSNQVGSQLSRLRKDGWIVQVDAPGRGRSYQVASRLFNLYYAMRFSRDTRHRLGFWVRFIELLFGPDQGQRALAPYLAGLDDAASGTQERHGLLRDAFALCSLMSHPDVRDRAHQLVLAKAIEAGPSRLVSGLMESLPGDQERAIHALRKGVELDPDSASGLRHLGLLLAVAPGQVTEAIRTLERSLVISPGDAEVLAALGTVRLRTDGGAHTAADSFRRAIEIDPRSEIGHLGLAAALETMTHYRDAAAALQRALIDLPGSAALWLALGTLRGVRLQDHAGALLAFQRAVELDESHRVGWRGLSAAARAVGDRGELRRAVRRSVEIYPTSGALDHLAWTLFEDRRPGDLEEALGHARAAVEKTPKSPNILHTLASILAALGRWEEAGETMGESFKRATEAFTTEHGQDCLALLGAFARAGRASDALEVIGGTIAEEAWEPAVAALEVLATGDETLLRRRPQEIRELAQVVRQRFDNPLPPWDFPIVGAHSGVGGV